jgi:hypothetical protein
MASSHPEHRSMRDINIDEDENQASRLPTWITLEYNGVQQMILRPQDLANVRNNASWAFNLSNRIQIENIVVKFKDKGRLTPVFTEEGWLALRSRKYISTFVITVVRF